MNDKQNLRELFLLFQYHEKNCNSPLETVYTCITINNYKNDRNKVCIFMYMYTHMYAGIYIHMFVYMYVPMFVCMYMHRYMYLSKSVLTYVCIYICDRICENQAYGIKFQN